MKFDWVLHEAIDGMAYQTLDIILLHEKWKVAPYGACIKYLSFKKWPEVKGGEFGSPLIPTPDMMRRHSLSYWGMTEVPPSEKVVAKAKPLDATELVDRIVANRTRRDEALRVRREKKRLKQLLQRFSKGKSLDVDLSTLFHLTILILNGSIGLEFQKNFTL